MKMAGGTPGCLLDVFIVALLCSCVYLAKGGQCNTIGLNIRASGRPVAGENYTLTCTDCFTTRWEPIQWFDSDDNPINDGVSNNPSMATSNLTFSPLAPSDAGEYSCGSVEGSRQVTERVTVTVPSPTVAVDGGGRVYAGSMLNLTCTIRVPPSLTGLLKDLSVTATWTGPNQDDDEVTSTNRITVSPATVHNMTRDVVYNSTVVFNTVQTSDSGVYNCSVSISPMVPHRQVTSGVGNAAVTVNVIGPSFSALTVVNVKYFSATVQWTVAMISYIPEMYVVNYGTDMSSLTESSQPRGSRDDFSAVNQTFEVQITGLSSNTLYYYQLVANNSFGHSYSHVMSFRTPDFPAAGPVVVWKTLSESVVRIEWEQPEVTGDFVLHYIISMRYYAGSEIESRNVSAEDTHVTIFNNTHLSAGVPYNVTVIAVTHEGAESPSTITNFTDVLPAPAPSGVMAERNGSGTDVVVSWSRLTLEEARGFVQYYIIYIRVSAQQKRQTALGGVCDATNSPCLAPEGTSSIKVTNLEPSSDYIIAVAAANGYQLPPNDQLVVEEDGMIVGEESEPLAITAISPSEGGGDDQSSGLDITWIAIGAAAALLATAILVVLVALLAVVRRRQKANRSHQRSATISANAESNSYESPYVTVRHTQQQWNLKQPNDYEVPVSSAQSKTEFLGMREAGQPYDYEVPVSSVQQTVCQGSANQHEYAIPIVKSSQRTPQASQRQNIRHGGQASLPIYVTQKSATMAIPIVNNPSTGRTQLAVQPSPDDGRLLSSSALFIETASL